MFEHYSFRLQLAFKTLSLHFFLTLVPLKLKKMAASEPQHPTCKLKILNINSLLANAISPLVEVFPSKKM